MISLCIGRREQGKSTLAYHLALQSSTRVIVDPRALFETSSDILPNANGLYDLLDTRQEIIVQPEEETNEIFEAVCVEVKDWLQENPDEPFALLGDEARFFDTPSYIPSSLDWILRMSSRKLVHAIFTMHRPVDISVDIRAIADYWFIFHTTQEHDLKVIAERCGQEVAELVSNLDGSKNELIVWDDAHGTFRKETDRSKWYHSLSLPMLPSHLQEQINA
jgi:hypothetical protein